MTLPAPVVATGDTTRSLGRAVDLLRLLAHQQQRGWRISDLACQAELEPGTAHRLLARLVDCGLATRVPGSRHYALGPLAYHLGLAATTAYELPAAVSARLQASARQLRGTVVVKVRCGHESVCIARFDGSGPTPGLLLDPGGRRPLIQTAGGIAMLLRLPADEQRRVEAANLRQRRLRERRDDAALRGMALRSRVWGFGVNLGDMVPGLQVISRAVMGPASTAAPAMPLASVGIALAGPTLVSAEIGRLARGLDDAVAAMADWLASSRYRSPDRPVPGRPVPGR